MNEHEGLPGLAFLSACWHWVDEFIVILSIPMLVFGATVTVVDLLTDGAASVSWPWLVVAWAVSQALGIEANVSGSIHKAKMAYERGAWVVMVLYGALCLALGSVIVVAAYVYSYHQTRGIPIEASLRDLGIDPATWVMSRSVLAFVLIAVSVLTRFTGHKPDAASKAAKLQEKLLLLPLQQQLRESQLAGGQRLIAQARGKPVPQAGMGAAAPSTVPQWQSGDSPNLTPFGELPWGVDLAAEARARGLEPANRTNGLTVVARDGVSVDGAVRTPTRTPRKKATQRKPRGADNWRDLARAAWDNGKRTVVQLERAVVNADGQHISHGAAQYWRAIFAAYEAGASERERVEA